jgi:putative glycerol-1-phosphate prenyltransferase
MNSSSILSKILTGARQGRKMLAVLIDPDKTYRTEEVERLVNYCSAQAVDFFLVGGSLTARDEFARVIGQLKKSSDKPVIIFPGQVHHLSAEADGVLFLSLISGRNPEYLIGQHVMAAPLIRQMDLEPIPTGYILAGSDHTTTVAYISNTMPIPAGKCQLAAATALAGEMLGMQLIYLDAGSGASAPVPSEMVRVVKKSITVPLIVGGGIDSEAKAKEALAAGADLLVIGNGAEGNIECIGAVASAISACNRALQE